MQFVHVLNQILYCVYGIVYDAILILRKYMHTSLGVWWTAQISLENQRAFHYEFDVEDFFRKEQCS